MYIVYYSDVGCIVGRHYSLSCINISLRYAYNPGDCVWLVPGTFDCDGNSIL